MDDDKKWGNAWKDIASLGEGTEYEREMGIKDMFYDWSDEMDVIRKLQKCQRVWDHSKRVHEEVIDYLLWTAENSPSKQYEGYYDVYWTADRKVLDELSKYTWGCTHIRKPPSTWQNSQMNANLYILFVAKEPDTQLNCHADGSLKSNKDSARWENAYVSIGIAMGLVMRAAAKIGLATGCNKSHGDLNGNDYWEKRLGILDDVIDGKKKIAYGIGVGFPKEDVERYESDQTELAIGAGNGDNLTTEGLEINYRTGRPFRKIKIVDITKHGGEKMQDPYGEWHEIPKKADIKINTIRKRNIKIEEIK